MLNSCRNLRDTNLRDKKVRNRVNQRIKDLKKRYWEKFISDMEHNLFIFIEIWKRYGKCYAIERANKWRGTDKHDNTRSVDYILSISVSEQ